MATDYETKNQWEAYEIRRNTWTKEWAKVDAYEFVAQLLHRHGFGAHDKYLDLGCGDGHFLHHLYWGLEDLSEDNLFGVDSSATALEKARSRNSIGTLKQRDIGVYEPELHGFDVVTSLFTLYHIADLPRFFEIVSKYLAPGGAFVLATLDTDSLHKILDHLEVAEEPVQSAFQMEQHLDAMSDVFDIEEAGMVVSAVDFETTENVRDFIGSTLSYSGYAHLVNSETPTKADTIIQYALMRKPA